MSYLMENSQEATRLATKTNEDAVRKQAAWLGIKPGSRVLDMGCGSGKTTSILHDIVQPGGEVIGIDFSEERIAYARENFGGKEGIDFQVMDFTKPIEGLGEFDFIWIKFVLEYFLKETPAIIRSISSLLKADGQLCVLDLDYNCLSHHEMPAPMADVFKNMMNISEERFNFDPYLGRKLYSYFYDADYREIDMHMEAHHLIYGELQPHDEFNWLTKVQQASRKIPELFENYDGGYQAFESDFMAFFKNPRRFTYTPLIICKGQRPEIRHA